jgi:hypothetical protein
MRSYLKELYLHEIYRLKTDIYNRYLVRVSKKLSKKREFYFKGFEWCQTRSNIGSKTFAAA